MPSAQKNIKVAIVHDWLIAGGAERVVEALHRLYPDAPIYTSYCTPEWRRRLDNKVVTGYLQHLGAIRKFIPFLRIRWFGQLDFSEYDLVISSSGAEAKGITVPAGTPHIAYIHAPTHYYWSRYDEYMENPGFGAGFNWLARIGLRILVKPLRNWDYNAAQKPDYLIANSSHTQAAIQRYYGRESTVVFPPVAIKKFSQNSPGKKRHGFVITGRQTPYKRVDLAVQACTQLDLPLTVIGTGPEHKKLKDMAGPSVTFLGFVDDATVAQQVAQAEAFIFPGVDDFGIAPVEALAAGTPVIAYHDGGALDYVIPGITGEFFDEQTVEALCSVLVRFKSQNYSAEDIKQQARQFSDDMFIKHITQEIEKTL